MVRIKAKVKKDGRATRVKAGHSAPKNVGGIANRKAVMISRKLKNG